MEKKQIIIIVLTSLLFIGACSQRKQSPSGIPEAQADTSGINLGRKDTISFASEKSLARYKDSFLQGSDAGAGIIFNTSGLGQNVWVDSLYYLEKHEDLFVAVASTPDWGYLLLYYNGDSLQVEKVAINTPRIEVCDANSFKVVNIADSSLKSGYLIKSLLFLKIDGNGKLAERKEYFPQKKAEGGKYDFTINMDCAKDSVVLYKNKGVEYVFRP